MSDYKTSQSRRRGVLTDDQVRQMRAEYVPHMVGYKRLADKFRVSPSTARDICTYRTRYGV